jgi:hypothetical protein
MLYIEALTGYKGKGKSLFLAGGITDCPDWQSDLVSMLKNEPITILNPRRKKFPMNDPSASKKQILWEFNHLRKADAISFWFPKEKLCAITLYELGTCSMMDKPLFVGVHPKYKRRRDIEIQLRLVRPEVKIVYDLKSLAKKIKGWV